MEYELDSMMGFDKLELYFEAHMAGIDGECFSYSVYFEDAFSDEKLEEIDKAIREFVTSYHDNGTYLGYVDVSKMDDKANIYLDIGSISPEDSDTAIKGILKTLNSVSGIKSVLVNEDCDFDF